MGQTFHISYRLNFSFRPPKWMDFFPLWKRFWLEKSSILIWTIWINLRNISRKCLHIREYILDRSHDKKENLVAMNIILIFYFFWGVAADRLMHLTSRDGDWFLDELSTMCGNISQLLSVLKNNPVRPQQLPNTNTSGSTSTSSSTGNNKNSASNSSNNNNKNSASNGMVFFSVMQFVFIITSYLSRF